MTDLYTNLLASENRTKKLVGMSRDGRFSKNADRFEEKHEWLFAVVMGVLLGIAIIKWAIESGL
jgi:hypothetical protein